MQKLKALAAAFAAYMARRMCERSTWMGLSGVLGSALGAGVSYLTKAELHYIFLGTLVCSLIAIFTKTSDGRPDEDQLAPPPDSQ